VKKKYVIECKTTGVLWNVVQINKQVMKMNKKALAMAKMADKQR